MGESDFKVGIWENPIFKGGLWENLVFKVVNGRILFFKGVYWRIWLFKVVIKIIQFFKMVYGRIWFFYVVYRRIWFSRWFMGVSGFFKVVLWENLVFQGGFIGESGFSRWFYGRILFSWRLCQDLVVCCLFLKGCSSSVNNQSVDP